MILVNIIIVIVYKFFYIVNLKNNILLELRFKYVNIKNYKRYM